MEAIINGTVVRSIKNDPKKKYFATSIFQNDTAVIPDKIGTINQHKPGDKVSIRCRIDASYLNGKSYLIALEIDQNNGNGQAPQVK